MPPEGPPVRRSKDELEKDAERVLRHHGLYGIPVDPIRVAQAIGIVVRNAHFSEPNVSGLIAQRGVEKIILVNANDVPGRKRFSIAHELGHHFLHLSEGDGELITSSFDLLRESEPSEAAGQDRWTEWQANYFAGALLMPRELLKEAHRATRDAGRLAQMFNVSKEAMEVRLRQLGLE